jgi:LPXTG-motif cell wall-anchored protein
VTAIERRGSADTVYVVQRGSEAPAEVPETLPQTASPQPLWLLLGMLGLGSAGLLTVARALRVV